MSNHVPVLSNEVVDFFKAQKNPPRFLLEGTFGRGGHTKLLLGLSESVRVCSFDKDFSAIEYGQEKFQSEIQSGRLRLIHDSYENYKSYSLGPIDGGLLDLGVSSPQLDTATRGFSFMQDGPLDMRMDVRQKITAAEIINEWSEKDLESVFKNFGEVRSPYRVIRAVVHDRKTEPFETTRQLASLIERVECWKRRGVHPATNYFMALRIAVNDELENLSNTISDLIDDLTPFGRLEVISFHSLEDRIVKNTFKSLSQAKGTVLTKKIVAPSDQEIEANPRSRSAKLRVFEKDLTKGELQ